MYTGRGEWESVFGRARAVIEAVRFHLASHTSYYGTGNYLMTEVEKSRAEIRKIHERRALSPKVTSCIERRDGLEWVKPSNAPRDVAHVASLLAGYTAELEYHLRDHDTVWASQVERAFLHLNHTLFVDKCVRARWSRAFVQREEECEKLGALHLLSHGIWAFKAHGLRERTDLILGTRIVNPSTRARRAVDVLTRTE
ncbi:MAG: hypothetical protein Q8P41_26820 [Pseudomonadota bacterium]|nr:hypothetical protein [Pseudomonadota bacterium]